MNEDRVVQAKATDSMNVKAAPRKPAPNLKIVIYEDPLLEVPVLNNNNAIFV